MRNVHLCVVAVFLVAGGCKSDREPANPAGSDAADKLVRSVISELLNVESSKIAMDRPISDPPLNADDLDLVEIVMELEERQRIEISDAAIERYLGGRFGTAPPRISPNQLAEIVRGASKSKGR